MNSKIEELPRRHAGISDGWMMENAKNKSVTPVLDTDHRKELIKLLKQAAYTRDI